MTKPYRPSAALVEALKLVEGGMSPYAAAKQVGIALSTMYRSPLYRALKSRLNGNGTLMLPAKIRPLS